MKLNFNLDNLKNIFSKIKNKKNVQEDNFNELDEDLESISFQTKNKFNLKNKKIIIALGVSIVIVAGFSATYIYIMNNNNKFNNLSKELPKIKKTNTVINSTLKKKEIKTDKKEDQKINNNLLSKLRESSKNNKKINNTNVSEINKNEKKIYNEDNNLKIKTTETNKVETDIEKPLIVSNNKIENKKSSDNKKSNLNIIEKNKEKKLVESVKNDDKIIKELLPIINENDNNDKKDIYSLTSENIKKLEEMGEYMDKKEKQFEQLTKYYVKKQKYLEALKNFEDFNKDFQNEDTTNKQEKLKEELNKKIEKVEQLLNTKVKDLNNNLENIKNNKNEEKIVDNNKIENSDIKKVNDDIINKFFYGGQIFSMNNDFIIVVSKDNIETIYKKGDIILDGFLISDITSNIVTLEKNNELYFHNIKNTVSNDKFSKVIVQMPMMVDNSKDEKSYNKDKVNTDDTNVKKYLTPTERKQEEAKKFFNIKTSSSSTSTK